MTSNSEEKWPSQDGIDRSESFAIIAFMGVDHPTGSYLPGAGVSGFPAEVLPQLQSAVSVTISEFTDAYTWFSPPVEMYEVGPAVGGFGSHYIATVWESRDAIQEVLSAFGNTWAVFEISRRVKNRLDAWASTVKWPGTEAPITVNLSFPPGVLRDFCIEHVRRTYHPRAKLSAQWHVLTKEFYGGYMSPAHPTEAMEYMVVVEAGTKQYAYHVKGSAEVVSLGLRDGVVAADLPIPDLLPPPDVVIPRLVDDPD